MEERHGARIAAVLATDSDLEAWISCATPFDRLVDQLANPVLVERLEGVVSENSRFDVVGQKPARVIA